MPRRMRVQVVLTLLALVVTVSGNADGQSFHPIETTPSPFREVEALAIPFDISPDGTKVGGTIVLPRVEFDCASLRCTTPFDWSIDTGIGITSFPEFVTLYETQYHPYWVQVEEVVSVTSGVSLTNGSMGYHNEPILFGDGGPRLLRTVDHESPGLFATAISDDAGVVVGSSQKHVPFSVPTSRQPFKWTEASGVVPIEIGKTYASATGVSGDGHVLVGTSGTNVYDPFVTAFRWSEAEGATFLNSLHPNGGSFPTGASHDGSVIVGSARGDHGFIAYRWTDEQGTVPLDLLQDFSASAAEDISADGQTVVGRLIVNDPRGLGGSLGWGPPTVDLSGYPSPASTADGSHAMIWDTVHGTRLLRDVLVNPYGLGEELEGWALVTASAISADGKVIAGVGVNPAGEFQGWVVRIPEPRAVVLMLVGLAVVLNCRVLRRRS